MNICFVSLGCAKNTVDSEVMIGLAIKAGHKLCYSPEEADAVVINTCGFIEDAKRESIETILEYVRLKDNNPSLKIIATGCLTQRYRHEIQEEIPELDAVLGVNDIPFFLEALEGKSFSIHSNLYTYDHSTPRSLITPPHYAYVKISEGCSHSCTFCAIPSIRGPYRSRRPEDIFEEVKNLICSGVKEIILIGQDTTAYGYDLDEKTNISVLLKKIDKLEGDFWIRLLYTYPAGITEDLLSTIASGKKICPYLDIPLQHAHRDILRLMGRTGDGEYFLKLINSARSTVPELAIRTTFITGFPGETDSYFRALVDFIKEARFDHLGVFTYSDEDSTPASELPGKVAKKIAKNRKEILMKTQLTILKEKAKEFIDKKSTALVEGVNGEVEMLIQARLPQQAPEVDSVCYLVKGQKESPKPGTFAVIRIKDYVEYDFTAELI